MDGWTLFSGDWHFAGTYSFFTAGDQTAILPAGTRVRITQQGSDIFGVVSSSSYSSTTGKTTVNLVQIAASTLTNNPITGRAYSYELIPKGHTGDLAPSIKVGNSADRATIKGVYVSSTVAVAVPSITDPDIARVLVDVSAGFTIQPAVGDAVIAIPQEALPTNARLQGAWVYQTDGVEITFGSEGGNVIGANKNFIFLVFDLT